METEGRLSVQDDILELHRLIHERPRWVTNLRVVCGSRIFDVIRSDIAAIARPDLPIGWATVEVSNFLDGGSAYAVVTMSDGSESIVRLA